MRSLRLRFWLRAMDVAHAVSGFGSPVFLWTLERASDATDWGPEHPSAPIEGGPF